MATAGPFKEMRGPVLEQTVTEAVPGGDAVAQGLQAIDPNTASAIPATSTTQRKVDPTRPGGGAGGFNFQVKAPNYGGARMTNEDFGQRNPYNIAVDGHQFSQPSFGLPAAAIARRLQGLAQEDAALKQQQQQLFAEDARVKVKEPYRMSYNQLWKRAQDEYVQGLAAQYGGDENKAWAAIVKDPKTRREYEQFHQQMNDLGEVINYDYGQAEQYVNDVQDGKRRYDQDAFTAAQDLMRGFNELGQGGFGDVQQLLRHKENYRRSTTLPYFMEHSGADKHIKDFMERTFRDEQGNSTLQVNKQGGFTVFTWEDAKRADQQIDAFAEEFYPIFKDDYATLEEFKDRLHQWYPIQTELKVQAKANPQPKKSSSDKAKDKALGVQMIMEDIPEGGEVEQKDRPSYLPGGIGSGTDVSVKMSGGPILRLRSAEGTDLDKPVTVSMGNGMQRTILPRYIEKRGNEFFLVGHSAEESEKEVDTAAEGSTAETRSSMRDGAAVGRDTGTSKEVSTSTKQRMQKALIRVPITDKLNRETVGALVGGRDWRSYFGASGGEPPKPTTNAQDPLGIL